MASWRTTWPRAEKRRDGGGGDGSGGVPRIRRWCVWWWWLWWGCLLCCSCCCGVVEGQKDCEDDGDNVSVAVVVVASVFVTLLVVTVVLVVVYIVLRRRHGGFLFPPKRTRKSLMAPETEPKRFPHRGSCFDNPAFSAQETVDLEDGSDGTYPERNNASPRKMNTEYQKTESSALPGQHVQPQNRRASAGSMDDCSSPETVKVWLQSQDIIGLGFNIGGNMRDGIFVSQVHNRGPALDSGLVQVGDRIRRVSIVYDNMVYEDALTILSYASPYPVQLTLQKERMPSTDSMSRSSERLHHPLFRSQSLETLPNSPGVVHVFKPKRWQSELRSETRKESPKNAAKDRRSKTLTHDFAPSGWDFAARDAAGRSNVVVHANDVIDGSPNLEGYQGTREKMAPLKNGDVRSEPLFVPPSERERSPQAAGSREDGEKDAKQTPALTGLMDQMLHSYSDDSDDIFSPQAASVVSTSPKTPPVKPERKKKSSTASIASDDSFPELSHDDGGVEEVCVAVKTAQVQALLPGSQEPGPEVEEVCVAVKTAQIQALPPGSQDTGPEVEEEEIQPTHVKRKVVINAEGLDLAFLDKPETQGACEERPASPSRYVYVKKPSRPPSPDSDPVEEDFIEAAVAARNTQAPRPPRSTTAQHTQSSDKDVRQMQGMSVLDEDSLELLIVQNQAETTDLLKGGTEQHARDARSGFPLYNDVQQPSQHAISTVSDDFVTIDLTDLERPGEDVTFRSSQSDNQLQQHHAKDSQQNRTHLQDQLGWSGQRLVRAGSFSEIPHADSGTDWMDTLNDDDDNFTASGKRSATDANPESDPEATSVRILPSTGGFQGRENLANLSDLSNSVSSSRSSSPPLVNGPGSEEVGIRVSGGGLGDGHTAPAQLTSTPNSKPNSRPVSFDLNFSADDSAEC